MGGGGGWNKAWLPSRDPAQRQESACPSFSTLICPSQPLLFIAAHLQRLRFPALNPTPCTTALPVRPNLSGAGAYRPGKTPEYRPPLHSGRCRVSSEALGGGVTCRAIQRAGV